MMNAPTAHDRYLRIRFLRMGRLRRSSGVHPAVEAPAATRQREGQPRPPFVVGIDTLRRVLARPAAHPVDRVVGDGLVPDLDVTLLVRVGPVGVFYPVGEHRGQGLVWCGSDSGLSGVCGAHGHAPPNRMAAAWRGSLSAAVWVAMRRRSRALHDAMR